ncbi:MAG: hypothetical protein R3F29_01570 [Planctomycetota bacterium]
MRQRVTFLTACLLATPLLPAQLLRDLNTLPQGGSTAGIDAYPDGFVEAGGRLYFSATTGPTGRELFWIDGSGGAPQLLADVAPGSADANPEELLELPSGLLLFIATHPSHGRGVWVSDGTAAGTNLLLTATPGLFIGGAKALCVHQGLGYFLARTGGVSYEVWRTDGTPAGTVFVYSLGVTSNLFFDDAQQLVSTSSGLFFAAQEATTYPAGEWRLYWSDGTPGMANLLAQVSESSTYGTRDLTAVGDRLVFTAANGGGLEPWVSDGTPAGTSPLDLIPGPAGSNPAEYTVVGGTAYFSANEPPNNTGGEIYATDGTVAGTFQLTSSTYAFGRPTFLQPLGSLLAYAAPEFTTGSELWVTSAAAGSESLYADFDPGMNSGNPIAAVPLAGGVVCSAQRQGFGRELFFSDGTPNGTFVLKDIVPGSVGSNPGKLIVFQNHAYFGANDGLHGYELWVTDGTPAGTQLYWDLAAPPQNQSSYPQGFVSLGDRALFAANDGLHGKEVWVSDGSALGTQRLTDMLSIGSSVGSGQWQPMVLDGRAVFALDDGVHGIEPWISDGTVQGTHLLADVRPGVASASPVPLIVWRGELWFAAHFNSSFHWDLFATDGTAAGTRHVLALGPFETVFTQPPVPMGDRLYFAVNTAAAGAELWSTDGTTAGTAMVLDLRPGTASAIESFEAVEMNGDIYFAAAGVSGDRELWRTDGTAAGTSQVADVNPTTSSSPFDFHRIGDRIVFGAMLANQGQYFGSDGVTVQQLSASPLYINGNWKLYEAGPRLVGMLRGPGGSSELWGTDGTAAGSGVIRQIGATSSEFANLRAYRVSSGDKLLFRGNTAATGTEWFVTDGTFAGTAVFADVLPGAAGSEPTALVRVGDSLLFDAYDPTTGWELYRLPWSLVDEWLAEPFGRGCAAAGGEVARYSTSGAASPGATLDVHVTQAAPSRPVAHFWSSAFAFVDLGACSAYLAQANFAAGTVTDAAGVSTLPIAIPNTPAMLGASLWLQSLVVDVGGAFLGLGGLTDALEVRVGS